MQLCAGTNFPIIFVGLSAFFAHWGERGGGHWKEYKNINYSVQFLAFSCKKVVNLKQTNTAKLSDLNNELDHALLREKFVKNYSFLTMHFLLYFAHSYV